ncbi:p-hydroxybenzoic acid efflux pump subunit AaeB [invertebrate metagenome]|uniref:p-hydroxybenzoic acid efflux pump subunit AaeB n=1 Tax=invertebrate metagenome TaxID=1711999 RepID=A0A2H9T6G1_9ZZZZ
MKQPIPIVVTHFLSSLTLADWAKVLHIYIGLIAVQWFAFRLNIASAMTALIPVLLVSQPFQGMMFAKAFNRLIGTVIGAVVGIILIIFCGQAPALFFLLLAIWLGLCTWLSSYIWPPMMYSIQLAGYTLIYVAIPSLANPETVFTTAIHRVTDNTIGVIVVSVLASIIIPVSSRKFLKKQMVQSFSATLELFQVTLNPAHASRKYLETRQKVISAALSMQENRIHAYLENLSDGKTYRNVTALIQLQLSLGTMTQFLRKFIQKCQNLDHPIAKETTAEVLKLEQALKQHKSDPEALREVVKTTYQKIQHLAESIRDELTHTSSPDKKLLWATRFISIYKQCIDKLALILMLQDDASTQPVIKRLPHFRYLKFHHCHRQSLLRAIRPMVAMAITAGIWYTTNWSAGMTLMNMPCVFPIIFAAFPRPQNLAQQLLIGGFIGIIYGYLACFILLPMSDGFLLYILIQLPLVVFSGIMMTRLQTFGVGMATIMTFFLLLQPTNMASFDIQYFFNNAIATVVSFLLAGLIMRVVFPENATAIKNSIFHQSFSNVSAIIREQSQEVLSFESCMYDRLRLLSTWFGTSDTFWALNRQLSLLMAMANMIIYCNRTRHLLPNDMIRLMDKAFHETEQWLTTCSKTACITENNLLTQKLSGIIGEMERNLPLYLSETPNHASTRMDMIRVFSRVSMLPDLVNELQLSQKSLDCLRPQNTVVSGKSTVTSI